MRYYLTPDLNEFPLTYWFQQLRACLEQNSTDPESAELIVVGFDTAKERNWPQYFKLDSCYIRKGHFDKFRAIEAIKSIQKQFFGRRILLFNMSASQMDIGKILSKETGAEVTVAGLFNREHITHQDISFPPDSFVSYSQDERANRCRDILLSFKGRANCSLRREMISLNKFSDIYYNLSPKTDDVVFEGSNQYMQFYKSLNANSVFGLVIRGDMFWSYRLLEVMGAGAIPVIVSDDWVLPFSDILEWNEFSLCYRESSWKDIPDDLRNMSAEKIDKMQTRLIEVYNQYFSSIQKKINTVLQILNFRNKNS